MKNIKLDPTLKWKIAEIIEINESDIAFKIIDSKELKVTLFSKDLKWAYKKDIKKSFKIGDLIYIKKNKVNNWDLKQYPKINGGIVAIVLLPET